MGGGRLPGDAPAVSFRLSGPALFVPSVRDPAWPTLGPRLASVAGLLPDGARVADIGTDHALLAEALLGSGRFLRVIASDRAEAPLEAARERLGHRLGLELRLGDGLEPYQPGEVNAVVMAGFGGRAMRAALEPSLESLAIQWVVVQPTAGLPGLRAALMQRGFRLAEERAVREGNRGFISARFEAGAPAYRPEPLEALVGGLPDTDPLLLAFLEQQRAHLLRQGPRGAPLLEALERWLAGRTG